MAGMNRGRARRALASAPNVRSLLFPMTLAIAVACGSDDSGAGAQDGGGGDGTLAGGDGGAGADGGSPAGVAVAERGNGPRRTAVYIEPALTKAAAATMKLDASFTGTIAGNVYAQPLYVEKGPGGKGAFYAVTESNNVYALDETSGAVLWQKTLGIPAASSGAGCGNIAPIGITGTPYIDVATRTIYLSTAVAAAAGGSIKTHQIHALSIDDGAERAGGWPLDVSTVKSSNGGATFTPPLQNQRGALIALGSTLYVPYGGHAGDCGNYKGWVIAVPTANPSAATGYATPLRGTGIWAPGGLASDAVSVFASTGNSFGASTWQAGEAILRLGANASFSNTPADYFSPSDWQALDNGDVDLGGHGAMILDVKGATPAALVLALGKNGVAYLLDRQNLGGVSKGNGTTGEGVASAQVAGGEIIGAGTSYTTASGTYVAFHVHQGASGSACPNGQNGDLVALKIGASSPPTITTAWCANNRGEGSPIATSTDGTANAIVWSVGAQSNPTRLHGFDGDTGQPVFAGGGGGDVMAGVRRFTSPIAVKGRIIAAADNKVYAFKPQ